MSPIQNYFQSVGCRLGYEVSDAEIVIISIAAEKRERSLVYSKVAERKQA